MNISEIFSEKTWLKARRIRVSTTPKIISALRQNSWPKAENLGNQTTNAIRPNLYQ